MGSIKYLSTDILLIVNLGKMHRLLWRRSWSQFVSPLTFSLHPGWLWWFQIL